MNYTTRPAIKTDYSYCYRLTQRNMFELFSRHWGGWLPSAFRENFDPQATTIILYRGRRVGYFSLKKANEGIFLDNIQLSAMIQGRGLGTEILRKILSDHQFKPIRLTTFSDNPAMRLYTRLGFVISKREGQTVQMVRPVPVA